MQRSEAAKLVAILAAAYRDAAISDATADVYESMLLDLPFPAVQAAIQRLVCTSKWLPTIAEIRAAAADQERGPVRKGVEAWGDVLAEIRRTGAHGVPSFVDPLVADCVNAMGWRGLCLGDNEAADRARFAELYDALAARGRADVVSGRPLPAPRAGLAPASRIGLLLPEAKGKPAGAPVIALPVAPKAKPTAAQSKTWTAAELDAAISKGGSK
jgi:hypothetical protein